MGSRGCEVDQVLKTVESRSAAGAGFAVDF